MLDSGVAGNIWDVSRLRLFFWCKVSSGDYGMGVILGGCLRWDWLVFEVDICGSMTSDAFYGPMVV